KGELASGPTFHSVGLVSQFRTPPANVHLMRESVRLYRAIAAEVGVAAGWNPVGSLRLAGNPDTLETLRRTESRARALGLAVELVSPEEAGRLVPAMSPRGLPGALPVPDAGYPEPTGRTTELARRASAGGATLHTQTRIMAIERDGRGRIAAVVTDRGTIGTPCVVNAAGQWAPRVAAMVGRSLPIVPLEHQ